MYFNRKQLKIS